MAITAMGGGGDGGVPVYGVGDEDEEGGMAWSSK